MTKRQRKSRINSRQVRKIVQFLFPATIIPIGLKSALFVSQLEEGRGPSESFQAPPQSGQLHPVPAMQPHPAIPEPPPNN
jgi:hypothetical protein